jgi:hypothetical protein
MLIRSAVISVIRVGEDRLNAVIVSTNSAHVDAAVYT